MIYNKKVYEKLYKVYSKHHLNNLTVTKKDRTVTINIKYIICKKDKSIDLTNKIPKEYIQKIFIMQSNRYYDKNINALFSLSLFYGTELVPTHKMLVGKKFDTSKWIHILTDVNIIYDLFL